MTNKIYLTGFMGSGKSTIGPILANTLGWEFYDLDHVIEKKEGKKFQGFLMKTVKNILGILRKNY